MSVTISKSNITIMKLVIRRKILNNSLGFFCFKITTNVVFHYKIKKFNFDNNLKSNNMKTIYIGILSLLLNNCNSTT